MLDYTIRSGDTLSKIAKRFNVGLDAIVRFNGIRNPDRIRVGQKLKIPEATTDAMDAVVPPVAPPPPAPDDLDGPPINRTKFVLPPKEYIGEVKEKDLIDFAERCTITPDFMRYVLCEVIEEQRMRGEE